MFDYKRKTTFLNKCSTWFSICLILVMKCPVNSADKRITLNYFDRDPGIKSNFGQGFIYLILCFLDVMHVMNCCHYCDLCNVI